MPLAPQVVQPPLSLVVWVVVCKPLFPHFQMKCCLFSSVVLLVQVRWVGTVVVQDLRREWVAVEQPTYAGVIQL
jgi:hypothetical protein